MSFEHLKKLDITDSTTAWMNLDEIGHGAALELAPATQANSLYNRNMLALSGQRLRRLSKTDEISAEDEAISRAEDRELFPKFIIRGWRGMKTPDGEEIPYSRENARDLCAQLPDWLFDRVRRFASTPERFLNQEIPTPDPEDVVPN